MSYTAGKFREFDAVLDRLPDVLEFVLERSSPYSREEGFGYRLKLACEEAVVNTIKHGYSNSLPGKLRIAVGKADGSILVEIIDHGIPFNPLEHPIPAESDLGNVGMGIRLMTWAADEVLYRRLDGQNHLSLMFHLPSD